MSAADIFEAWAAVEADFQRYYRLEPLRIGWRRFRVLLANLPGEAMFRHALEQQPSKLLRRAVDQIAGRPAASRYLTLDQALAEGLV